MIYILYLQLTVAYVNTKTLFKNIVTNKCFDMKKVLVVDDDKDILEVVKLLLTLNNYCAQTIFKAEETLDEIKKFKPI
jgi:PleD family two-component response regulator